MDALIRSYLIGHERGCGKQIVKPTMPEHWRIKMRTHIHSGLMIFILSGSLVFAQEGNQEPPDEQYGASIRVEGGRIDQTTMPNLNQYGLNNLYVEIPENAVRQQLRLQIQTPSPECIPPEKAAVQAVEFTVEGHENGFSFEKPVTIGIPYQNQVAAQTALMLMYWNQNTGEWTPIDNPESIVVDRDAQMVRAQVNHFSIYGIVEQYPTGVTESAPIAFSLSQNFPNPFNPETTIHYDIMRNTHVTIDIYNMVGQHVRTLVSEFKTAGSHTVTWDGKSQSGVQVSNGIYFYSMKAGNFMQTRKLMLMK